MSTGTRTPTPQPVYEGYFADPYVFDHQGVFYAIGTGPADDASGRVFRMLRSEDLSHWESVGGVLEPTPELGTDYWAPEIVYREDRFVMVYSVGNGDRGQHLRVAFSDSPTGPYRDGGQPLLNREQTPFCIDGSGLQDVDGRWYLYYARDFLDSARPGTALAVAEWKEPTGLSADYAVVARATHDWQLFQANRPMYGRVFDWHTLEGPSVVIREGKYYCFYSGGNWQNSTYGVDYVVADHIMGPYQDDNDTGHARVLRTNEDLKGPGHNSLFYDKEGNLLIAFHAWTDGARRFYIGRIEWTSEGPRCVF